MATGEVADGRQQRLAVGIRLDSAPSSQVAAQGLGDVGPEEDQPIVGLAVDQQRPGGRGDDWAGEGSPS